MKNSNVYDQENRAVQDAYALLSANVHFSSKNEKKIKTVTLTSWMPQVGKTTVAINLAISLSRSGWKTLLVDIDIRKPGGLKRLNMGVVCGIYDIIVDGIYLDKAINNTDIPNLSYLSCGLEIDNPIELLCSSRFTELVDELRELYDFVIFDTPALSSVVDGALVSSQTDGVIVVAQMGKTKTTELKRAKEQLENANANIIGVVINKVKKSDYVKYVESYNYFSHFRKKKSKYRK